MKKQFPKFLAAVAVAASTSAFAQQASIRPCDTYAAMEQVFASDYEAKARYEKAQAELTKQLTENAPLAGKASAFEYTVPVVFHVLHTGGAENIADAPLIAALDWVNKDFARLHADANTVDPLFEPLYIPSDVKFMLAHKDPQGNPTTGVVHRYDERTVWDRDANSPGVLFAGITWNPTKYLNIIVVKDIVSSPGQQGIVVGYTYKPGTWNVGNEADAIVYNYGFFNGGNARSLTHEVGHWLNLSHTFGDTNNPGITCGDDGISDTPPTKGNFAMCPSSSSGNTCSGSGGTTNVENFMDYSVCPKNFTQGQTSKMRTALASSISGRSNLWQTANLSATGVNDSGPFPPIADFLSDKNSYTVCAGGSILMKNFSYNGQATSVNWAANLGATISSPSNDNTNIMFPNAGIATVSLTASNSTGSSTKTRQITVMDRTPGLIGPVQESFESFGLPLGWTVQNPNAGSPAWDQVFLAPPAQAYTGNATYGVNSAASAPNQEDILETPLIDMQASPEKKITFAYAFARKTNSHAANFKVRYSVDCGGTWVDLISLDAGQLQLQSGGVMSTPFEPTASQWKVMDFSTYPQSAALWNGIKNSPNLILRFVFKDITGGGNNFYLDAINLPGEIAAPTGIAGLAKNSGVELYPNPSNGAAQLSYVLSDNASVKVTVVNMLGAEVIRHTDGVLEAGEHTAAINKAGELSPGVYFVNLSVNGNTVSRKLVIE
jgi:PKD repeat protein